MREGRTGTGFLKKGEQRVGEGGLGRGRKSKRERERVQPGSKHLVRVERERFGEKFQSEGPFTHFCRDSR